MQILIEQPTIIMASVLSFLIILILWILWLELRLRKLTRGSNGKNLEKHIANIAKNYELVQKDQKDTAQKLQDTNTRLQSSVRGVGLTRFNPFAGSGDSKPSFALALLSENGNGIIVSTLHARDRVTLFSKQIVNFAPENEITDEERAALDKARDSLHNGL